MLLKQIQYFIKVVELNSFTDAAEVLFISQSAISQQIKLLEKELQVQLLNRSNRQFSLTPSGAYFYQHAKQCLNEVDKIKEKTKAIDSQIHSILKIGYLKVYDGDALQNAIFKFSQRYPYVELHVMAANHEDLYDHIKTNEVDLVINDQRRAFSNQYVNLFLYECTCYVELPYTHSYAKRDTLTMNELHNIPCILIASKNQEKIEQEFFQNVIGLQSNEVIFADSLHEARMLVAANRGYLFLEGTNQQRSTVMKRIPLLHDGTLVQRTYCAFWKKEMTNVYIEEFADLLKEEFQKEHV